jgi:hypothetical protein
MIVPPPLPQNKKAICCVATSYLEEMKRSENIKGTRLFF